MKTIILAINSQYVHTLLAPRYLLANCVGHDVEIIESNVNVQVADLLAQVYLKSPDVVAVSCYIFNIKFVKTFLKELKVILPNVKIILGGYEVIYDVQSYDGICDYIIKGEGDFAFNLLLDDIKNKTNKYGKIIEAGTIKELDQIISPYSPQYAMLGNQKILYMETTRGCPFYCSYCMSANTHGVRAFSLERTFDDINKLMQFTPKQIKFVDRTFNYDIKRAYKIFKFIIDNYSDTITNFHFEMAPELFSEQLFELLKTVPTGKFQFELGVQSYNQLTLDCVGRKADLAIVENNINRLVQMGNIIVHVDLIAGLPNEGLESFIEGFNRLFNLKPNCLQLGFLKLLKGSKIYESKNDYVVSTVPPYEIYQSQSLSYQDILQLKDVEDMLESHYNKGSFVNTINYLVPKYFSAYNLFLSLSDFYKQKGVLKINISAYHRCDMFFEFILSQANDLQLDCLSEQFVANVQHLINKDYSVNGNARQWRRNLNKMC